MDIRPFRGLRPRPDLADRIPSLPYDVVNDEEARNLVRDDPYSFLHVVRPEVDLDPGVSPYDERVYAQGRDNLHKMITSGWMVRDSQPAYYVYRLRMGDHEQTGIVGAAAVRDYVEGRIKRHEFTRPQKEDDRVKLNSALAANPGPVFLTYPALPELNAIVSGITAGEPRVAFEAEDGIHHSLWVVDQPSDCRRIRELFGKVRATYVADGHHRAAAAARVGAERLATLEEPTGDEPAHFFLAVHFPADQLKVLDYNRVVADLNGLDVETLLERIQAAGFHVKKDHRARRPSHTETFGMYVAGNWYLLTARPEIVPEHDVVRRLDVAILTERILQPILGLGDPRTDRRVDFVGGIFGMERLEKLVDSGEFAVAFALYPTRLENVMSVADSGEVMPPKSTWFEPKLRSGMVVQLLEGDSL